MKETERSGEMDNLVLKKSSEICDNPSELVIQNDTLSEICSPYIKTEDNSETLENSDMQSSEMATFHCERCKNFETNSRATLLLHIVQCLSNISKIRINPLIDQHNVNTVLNTESDNSNAIDGKLLPSKTSTNSITKIAHANSKSSSTSITSRKVFECDVCNMKFSNGANMRRHKMRHTGVKPYECRICQKRFFRKDHLAEHFATHTKTLPYHCPICNRGFQRQIAMRAHFQNEHVGHHDLVKSCPLCSYRAGSMKSLRIHFFNRHGIDLDNPGTNGSSSLLFTLETQASHEPTATTSASFISGSSEGIGNTDGDLILRENSDTLRSIENTSPPIHLLAPHIEISTFSENTADILNRNTKTDIETISESELQQIREIQNDNDSKFLPSSTSNVAAQAEISSKINKFHVIHNHVAPSISLIPIKQEPVNEHHEELTKISKNGNFALEISNEEENELESFSKSSRLSSMIKVSPLKSLLREDLRRRICAKANNRMSRTSTVLDNNNTVRSETGTHKSTLCNSIPICNGTITSTGLENETQVISRKQILTCLFCGIDFPNETLYFLHKGCHSESSPWKCNICGEQCNNVYEFNSHLLSKSHQ